jgi:long-chain acyl-CoA synthetase
MESTESAAQAGRVEARASAQPLPYRNAVDLFVQRVASSGARVVFRSKVGGAWRTATWSEWDAASREIAAGLSALGLAPGERAAVLASTRAEWMYADIGVLMAGAVTVPIYQSSLPDECAYIIGDSGARIVFAENPHQLEKLVAVRERLGGVQKVVYFDAQARLEKPDAKGRLTLSLDDVLDASAKDWVVSLEALRAAGKKWLGEHPGELERRFADVKPSDLLTLVYTSGTTGPPKGVMLTHENVVFTADAVRDVFPIGDDDEQLLFLPLAHIFAKILQWTTVQRGSRIAFAESIAQVVANLGEVRPNFFGAVPRVYEKVYARIQANRAASPPTKQKIFDWAIGVGRQVSRLKQQGRAVPLLLEAQRAIAHKLVYSKIHAVLGGRIKFLVSGGAPLAREIAEFFNAVGVLILEGYGLTETTAATCVNRPTRFRFGSVGPVVPGVEVKIADDGEILIRGRSVFAGYYNQPEATREAIDAEGWFHSGDIGRLDDGFLLITDRKKDLIITAGGKNIAPQNLENALKTTPYVSQAMVYGDRRPYLTALITLNEEAVRSWAKEHGLVFTDLADLAGKEEVRRLVQKAIDDLNASEPSYSTIKKFAILPADFSQETGELTPTLKVKRKFTTEKYRALLDEFYTN